VRRGRPDQEEDAAADLKDVSSGKDAAEIPGRLIHPEDALNREAARGII
jgi:hypothetical protein